MLFQDLTLDSRSRMLKAMSKDNHFLSIPYIKSQYYRMLWIDELLLT